MKSRYAWMTSLAAVIAVAAALLATATAGARAQCRRPSAGPLAPQLTNPCAGARIRAGQNFVWRVRDTNSKARQYPPYLNVTRRKPRHGILPDDTNGNGIFAQMKRVRGRPGQFSYKVKALTFPGYWLITKGTWYVQVQQIDSRAKHGQFYSPVEKITIH